MGFSSADAVPVRHRKIFHSGLPERAQSSSRMSMVLCTVATKSMTPFLLRVLCHLWTEKILEELDVKVNHINCKSK